MVENNCTIFPLTNLSTFVQKTQKINEWIKIFQSQKESSSWKSFCHWNIWEKCNRFSILMVNMWDLKWMTYHLMSDVTERCGLKWWTRQTFCLDLFLIASVVWLCIFCYANYLVWKQKVPCTMHILNFEVELGEKKSAHYTQVNTVHKKI